MSRGLGHAEETHPNPSSGKSGMSDPEDGGLARKSSRTDVHTWRGCPGENVPGNAHFWLMLFLVTAVKELMWCGWKVVTSAVWAQASSAPVQEHHPTTEGCTGQPLM